MPDPSTPSRCTHLGICPPARGAVIASLCSDHPASVWLVVAENLKAAEHLAEDLAFFHSTSGHARLLQTLVFPEAIQESAEMREAFAASSDRLTVLSRLRAIRGLGSTPDSLVVVTTPAALLQPVPALEPEVDPQPLGNGEHELPMRHLGANVLGHPDNVVEIDFEAILQTGPRMKVGQVSFEGQRHTQPRVIEARLSLEPGEWLDPLEVERNRRSLAQLGVFDRVEVRCDQADDTHRDIAYELHEAKTLSLSLLLGYGSYEQLRGGIEFEQRNTFGLAHDLRIRGIQSFKSSSGDIRYTIPQKFGEELDLFGYAAGLRREEISFTRREFGGGVGVTRYFAPIQSDANLRYDYQFLNATDISPETTEEVGLAEARVASVILDLRRDRRDSPLIPRRGLRLCLNTEFASKALGGEVDFQRILLGGSYHLRLGGGRYLHLGVPHGLSFTAGGSDIELPFNKRFFPGGQNSIRGFQEGEAAPRNAEGEIIGAETFLQGNLELEQMLTPN